MWHVIGLVYEKWGNLGQAKILDGMAGHAHPRRNATVNTHCAARLFAIGLDL